MERLTTNKPVSEMGIVDLAYNSCFAKDGEAWYRDFEKELSLRDYIRWLYKTHLEIELPEDIEGFDNYIITDLECGEECGIDFVIAFLYHMMWSKADLYERLKRYEETQEQGKLLELPCKVGDTVFLIVGDMGEDGKTKNIMVDTDVIQRISIRKNTKVFTGRYSATYEENFGNTVFLTKEEAEKALAEMEKNNG